MKKWPKLSKEESLQVIAEAEEKQRRDRIAELAYAYNKGLGQARELTAIISRMMRAGFKMEDICKATAMSTDEILGLKNPKRDIQSEKKVSKEDMLRVIQSATAKPSYYFSEPDNEHRSTTEGREEVRKQTALRMIRAGFKVEDICKATELSKDKILKLKNSD